jgi:hypothetical protein
MGKQVALPWPALPPEYHMLCDRIARLCDVMDTMNGDDELWPRAQAKRAGLLSELQALVDGTLGAATCPECLGLSITAEIWRRRTPLRVCATHDLNVIRTREQLRARRAITPSAGARGPWVGRPSARASTNSTR